MSPNVNVPQQRLLTEFDRLVPALLAADDVDVDVPFTLAQETQTQLRLEFEHSCRQVTCSVVCGSGSGVSELHHTCVHMLRLLLSCAKLSQAAL